MESNPKRPPLGFLAVEVNIHRPPGDPWNPKTWPFPLIHELVPGSKESQIVTKDGYDEAFIERFVSAGEKLAEKGAVGLITSCGFLAMAQKQLAARLPVPVATSALIQIPSILTLLSEEKIIGVLTYDDERLGPVHLKSLGIDPQRVWIRGMPADGHLRRVIQEGLAYDEAKMSQEMKITASQMIDNAAGRVGAIVLECTQMPPYAEMLQATTGVPVYDVYTMVTWFYSGVVRQNPLSWKQ